MPVEELQPTRIRRRTDRVDLEALKRALAGIGEIRAPNEAEEPILEATVRRAVHSWLVELNNVDALAAAGIKPRSTALLYGPPGCGKTTLAHHLAARLGIPMILVGSEGIFESRLGESEGNVVKLFDAIEASETRALLFLDEIDAIGAKRVAERGGGATAARNSTLNVLLRKIEAFDGILVGATNLADMLDPALWRRFGMQIDVALPDADARFAILKRYGEPFIFDEEAIDVLTDLTAGAAPSLLRQVMEGVKRLLVVGPKIGFVTDDPVTTFAAVLAQNKPHPDYAPPPLWSDPKAVEELRGMSWPPVRAA